MQVPGEVAWALRGGGTGRACELPGEAAGRAPADTDISHKLSEALARARPGHGPGVCCLLYPAGSDYRSTPQRPADPLLVPGIAGAGEPKLGHLRLHPRPHHTH